MSGERVEDSPQFYSSVCLHLVPEGCSTQSIRPRPHHIPHPEDCSGRYHLCLFGTSSASVDVLYPEVAPLKEKRLPAIDRPEAANIVADMGEDMEVGRDLESLVESTRHCLPFALLQSFSMRKEGEEGVLGSEAH